MAGVSRDGGSNRSSDYVGSSSGAPNVQLCLIFCLNCRLFSRQWSPGSHVYHPRHCWSSVVAATSWRCRLSSGSLFHGQCVFLPNFHWLSGGRDCCSHQRTELLKPKRKKDRKKKNIFSSSLLPWPHQLLPWASSQHLSVLPS